MVRSVGQQVDNVDDMPLPRLFRYYDDIKREYKRQEKKTNQLAPK